MRAARAPLGVVLLSLVATVAVVTGPVSSASPGLPAATTAHAQVAKPPKARYVPPAGVLFNDPMVPARRRVILHKVIRSIKNTARKQTIRISVWNLDDRPIVTTLLRANRRGVHVQVVVSGIVDNSNWDRLKRGLNRNTRDQSFAVQCKGGCRSSAKIMHSKFFLFSRIHGVRDISMFGSVNLTTPAGNRQWNDLVTVPHKAKLYNYLVKTFDQYARDKKVARPYEVYQADNRYRVTLFPAPNRNPVLNELRKVRCHGVTGGTGNGAGRTLIRIAIAGWFDSYGNAIAARLRRLWDQGCDVKIVTTLAGRGVNRTLKDPRGRGPVPIREVSVDFNDDGIPDRYLHLKSLAISGVYNGDTGASVLFTGSPNWSTRAQRSDELWVRILNQPGLVRHYAGHVNRLYASRSAMASGGSPIGNTDRLAMRVTAGDPGLPSWFELE